MFNVIGRVLRRGHRCGRRERNTIFQNLHFTLHDFDIRTTPSVCLDARNLIRDATAGGNYNINALDNARFF